MRRSLAVFYLICCTVFSASSHKLDKIDESAIESQPRHVAVVTSDSDDLPHAISRKQQETAQWLKQLQDEGEEYFIGDIFNAIKKMGDGMKKVVEHTGGNLVDSLEKFNKALKEHMASIVSQNKSSSLK
uniref:Putative secreted protein midgut overexpressed n=1 Tax=Rhipicephalus microplus TaxID=6941 RepID=A0A6M2DBN5_RHIMP